MLYHTYTYKHAYFHSEFTFVEFVVGRKRTRTKLLSYVCDVNDIRYSYMYTHLLF